MIIEIVSSREQTSSPIAIGDDVKKSLGRSSYTLEKQKYFSEILRVIFTICAGASVNQSSESWLEKRSFFRYIDLNCGCGWYEVEDKEVKGSPIIARDLASEIAFEKNCKFHLDLIDKSRDSIKQLKTFFSRDLESNFLNSLLGESDINPFTGSDINFFQGDNGEILDLIKDSISEQHLGLMYSDPNGFVDCPFESIKRFFSSRNNHRIDLLIHLNSTSLKRFRRSEMGVNKQSQPLSELIPFNCKRYWQIGRPKTAHGWVFLFGTNTQVVPELKAVNFVGLKTTEGQKRLNKVTYTNLELEKANANY